MNSIKKQLIVALSIAIIMIACSPYNSINLNNTFKASDIVSEFKKDSRKSNKKYIDKTLTIIGRIDQYYKNKKSEITIILSEKGQTGGIKCNLINSHKQIKKPLKQGSNIIIQGKCTSYNDLVIIDNCYIIP